MRESDRKKYEFLYTLDLTEEQIDKMFEENKHLFNVVANDIKQLVKFLMDNYKLSKEDIAKVSIENPWILTEDFQRIRILERVYKEVGISDYRELLLKQPISMSVNPAKADKLIKQFKEERKTQEEIKEILLNNFTGYLSL